MECPICFDKIFNAITTMINGSHVHPGCIDIRHEMPDEWKRRIRELKRPKPVQAILGTLKLDISVTFNNMECSDFKAMSRDLYKIPRMIDLDCAGVLKFQYKSLNEALDFTAEDRERAAKIIRKYIP